MLSNYPNAPLDSLKSQFIGKRLSDLPTPALVLDRALVRKNCNAMLEACKALDVGFRAHVKSHKTLELSQLQVGQDGPANFIVSTLAEAEGLVEYVVEMQRSERSSGILYGVPVPQSAVPRLLDLAAKLRRGSMGIIFDNEEAFLKFHEAVINYLPEIQTRNIQFGVFIKIDTGYGRAGIKASSPKFKSLVDAIVSKGKAGKTTLKGLYSHYGQSYAGNSEDDAARGLVKELLGLEEAWKALPAKCAEWMILSVGATPTATVVQNLVSSSSPNASQFNEVVSRLKQRCSVELHAGVYPLLDCQQIATHARPSSGEPSPTFQPLSKQNIAISVLAEVTSVYDERGKPEALISVGSLALGREPCKSYPGWGIVSRALGSSSISHMYDERDTKIGWIVGRISQEHGILTWEGDKSAYSSLEVGSRLLIWPNHACVAGAGFGWYLIVDSEGTGEHVVVDVWQRWRGW